MRRPRILHWLAVVLVAAGSARGWQQPQPTPTPTNPNPPASAPKPVSGPAARQPEDKTSKKTARRPVIQDLSGFDLLEPGNLSNQPMAAAATRGLPRPVALAPKLGKLYGTNPVFTWRYQGKGQNFVFTLLDDNRREIYRTDVIGTAYSYPSSAPPLEPGKTFFWTVRASSTMLGGEPSAPAGFIMLPPSQREAIEKTLVQITRGDAYQAGLARAELFTNHRLWYDTLAVYTDLIRQYPDYPDLYERRGMIYAQLGVTQELAEQDFARADELEHGPK